MTNSAILLRRLAVTLVASAFVAGIGATSAFAVPHSLSGNARFQIGDGLPVPIAGLAAPNGRINAVAGATVNQTIALSKPAMVFKPGQLKAAKLNIALGVIVSNSKIFQVRTSIGVSMPNATATLAPGGRTGPAIVSYCAGQIVGPVTNPGCGAAGAGPGINGSIRYKATGAQFGGPLQGALTGSADLGVRVGGTPPGVVTVRFGFATPAGTGAQGGPFGFKNQTAGATPGTPSGYGAFNATAGGKLTALVVNLFSTGSPNPATSYGAPWTTDKIVVDVTAAVGSPELFTFTGNDGRVSGVGPISLVSGATATRAITGPNANRGWLNLVVGLPQVPSMSLRGLAAVFGLLVLAGGYALQQRRVRS